MFQLSNALDGSLAVAAIWFGVGSTQHRIPDIRRAGFLYLLIAHLGAIGILTAISSLESGGNK